MKGNNKIETRQITLLVYDTKENFENTKGLIGLTLFKNVIPVNNLEEFKQELSKLNDDDLLFVAVHVFATLNIKGIKEFITSGILQDYPKLPYACITEKNGMEMQIELIKNSLPYSKVCKYHELSSGLAEGELEAISKGQLLGQVHNKENTKFEYPHFKYAIVIALYKDEFEEVKKVFDFPDNEIIKARKKTFRVGYLIGNSEIKIIAGVLNETGPVEAAIITAIMLELFRPTYIFMSGVCGGSKNYNFGDIIVAKKIFAFQKGKISDDKSILEIMESDENLPILFDKDRKPIDFQRLYNASGDQVSITIENFEIEHDAMINLDSAIEDEFKHRLAPIQDIINRKIKEDLRFQKDPPEIKISIEPMASGTMVINKKGYFENVLSKIDRKVAAVEMESYGVARACQFANDQKTTPIIFKSVMDHTFKKIDSSDGCDVKKFAAYTSAQFLKCIFDLQII